MNFFCKMIIGCNPKMIDFITDGLWHYVMGFDKDSGVKESVTTQGMVHD